MKRILGFWIVLSLITFSAQSQNIDTASVKISGYKLLPGTYNWRGPDYTSTNTFYDMTSWDSSPYAEGRLQQGSSFRMNYRLLSPQGYDANYDPGYPIIVMIHGAGERANCWNGNCYCEYKGGADCLSTNLPDSAADELPMKTFRPEYLNNDHSLVHGGSNHLNAVNLAGTKKPNDPTLHPRAFPGFVLFPQMSSNWVDSEMNNAIRIIRLLCKTYNIDQNRIYIHGLSVGGQAVYNFLWKYDWLFAAGAPMSGLKNNTFRANADSAVTIPLWIFQGGKDVDPSPGDTEATIRAFKAKGGSVRYTLYPSLGHGTWNSAYNEPDFFSWLLSKNKSQVHVYYETPYICGINGEGAKLGLSYGFFAYQWERDGQVIPGANKHYYTATIPGVYRARFSRISSTPTEAEWNTWSQPVTVTEVMPGKASIEAIGTTHLRGPNNTSPANNTVILKSNQPNDNYYWYKDGVLVDIPSNDTDDTVRHYTINTTNSGTFNGAYTLRTSGFDKCLSPESDPIQLFFNNSAPLLADSNIPTLFQGKGVSSTSILLTWKDNSSIERGYEIWRRKPDEAFVFIKRTAEDVISFVDTNLETATTYEYKIRGINNQGRTKYAPSDAVATNLSVTTLGDDIPPSTPQNLTATATSIQQITLTWEASPENDIEQYYIYYGSDSIATGSKSAKYVFNNLPLNTSFNFTVKAFDFSNNLSSPSNQATANTYVSGLYYKHTTGAWSDLDEATMVATWNNPEFTGKVDNFTLSPRTQEDYFNFEFTGYIYITTPGVYNFRTTSDDGSRLELNNQVIVDNDGLHGNVTVESVGVNLTTGPHKIVVKFFENGGGQHLNVQYKGPDTPSANWQTVPNSVLRSGNAPTTPPAPIAPVNLVASGISMTENQLSWEYNGQNPEDLKIVVLGSSTAEGIIGPDAGMGFVDLLRNWITTTTTGASVINYGKGGFDSYDVMPTGSTPSPDATRNITKALSDDPNIIIVNLPSNDAYNNIPLTTTMDNFRAIKNLADAEGVKIFFTTSQPRNNLTQRSLLDITADSIRNEFGNYVIDIYDELTNFSNDYRIKAEYHHGDQVHLNNAGHEYIFLTTQQKLLSHLTSFEIYRSLAVSGPFTLVARTNETTFIDKNLIPSTTYYYRIRTVNLNGNSAYTAVVNATTLGDTEAPSQPTGLQVTASTFSNVSLIWNTSTDNVLVTGYEVWANGVLLGTSPIPGYLATELIPNTSYDFHVIAYDASGNKSIASLIATTVTSNPDYYYSKASGDLNLASTWGKNPDGSGASPDGFSTNGIFLEVKNRTTADLAADWTVEGAISRVIVPAGVILTSDKAMRAKLAVSGTLNLEHATTPEIVTVEPGSTINYNNNTRFIQQITYHNLGLGGTGDKTFASGTTTVNGNLTLSDGVLLRGTAGNTSKLILKGDLTAQGNVAATPADFGVTLEMAGSAPQTITSSGDLYFNKIAATGSGSVINMASAGSPFKIRLGSNTDGGLSLPNGTKLNIGNNTLLLERAATINPDNETGRIAINNGDIDITSTSSQNSNLYFDPVNNNVNHLRVNVSGSGDVFARENVNITDGLKISRGEFQAGGFVTLVSNATKTANIHEIENGGVITGNVKVQRYMNPKGRVYRYISSAVAGVTVADWQTAFPITGNFTGTSTGPGLSTNPSLFYYQEPPSEYIAFPAASLGAPNNTNAAPIERGRGYAAFIRNANTPTVINTTGNPYQGTIALPMHGTGTGHTGWNLVGNPYASTIKWSNDATAWIKDGVNSVIAIRNNLTATTGQFMYYDAQTGLGIETGGLLTDGKIAPGQAFWVRATTATPSLTITEKAKNNEQQTHYRTGNTVSHLKINLQQNTRKDVALIAFTQYGTDKFDAAWDGLKHTNIGMFNLSTLAEGKNLAINNTSSAFCDKTVSLNIKDVTAGNYNLSFESLETLEVSSILLKDNFTGSIVDVKNISSYSFAVTADTASFGRRFSITFTRPDINAAINASASDVCESAALLTLDKTQKDVEYTVIDKSGTTLTEKLAGTGNTLSITIPQENLTHGLNEVKILAGFNGCGSKILPNVISFNYTPSPKVSVKDVSVCAGTTASLSASGAPVNGTYHWYTANFEKIKGVTTATFETAKVFEETYYYVSAVSAEGCEGAKEMITLTPNILYEPIVDINGVTLQNDVVSVCEGSTALLKASGTSNNGAYRWYRSSEEVINNITGSELETEELVDETQYFVSVITDTGCEGPKRLITLLPEVISTPVITTSGDTLITNANGNLQWYKDGEPLADAHHRTLVPSASGMYTVSVFNATCSKNSEPLNFSKVKVVTGIEAGTNGALSLSIYPNPSSVTDINIKVNSPSKNPVRIKMLDLVGRSFYEGIYSIDELKGGAKINPTQQLSSGVYFILVEQNDLTIKQKVLIKE